MEDQERRSLFADLWARAMRALARREHSEHELRQKFGGAAPDDLLDELIEALLRDDLLSDVRFAQMLCRSRYRRGIGPVRIEYELQQHGILSEWIEQAMAEYDAQWVEQLQDLRNRKYGERPPQDYREWARQARFFQGKGFTHEQIQRAIPRS